MTDEEARQEIRDAIAYYDKRGLCWLSAVTFIGIRWCFGGWLELCRSIRGRRYNEVQHNATRL